ncbi:MAG: outer membrane beta-barrel protein [Bacteroidota bacterium]
MWIIKKLVHLPVKYIYVLIIGLFTSGVQAQADTLELNLRVYGEVYYGIETSGTTPDQRLPFVYNHSRNNAFAVNLGMIQINADHANYRFRLGMHGGTYVQDNYAGEPEMLRYFSEASAGLNLTSSGKLWLDAGIFPSHIGFESAVNTENPTLTRSMIADLSPYYSCGAKLNWKPNEKLELEALVLNGWQRIAPIQGNTLPSFGTRATYTGASSKLNWSTFIGPQGADATREMRYFSNLFYTQNIGQRFKIIADVDAGIQERINGIGAFDRWIGLAAIFSAQLGKRSSIAVRGEWFGDQDDVVASFILLGADAATGVSLNYDRKIASGVQWRTEAKWTAFKEDPNNLLFPLKENSFFICSSILVDLNRYLH